MTVTAKRDARAALRSIMMRVGGRVRSFPSVTPAMLKSLGMVIPDGIKTKIPAPQDAAHVTLIKIERLGHAIRVSNPTTPTRRALPRGTIGYAVFSAVHDFGAKPPEDERDYQFEGVGTRPTFHLKYRGDDAGRRATVYVRYLNAKGQLGPRSSAVSCLVAA